jgi:hypothetical protein
LETSRELPGVKMGGGVILRVGDKASIFDSEATRFLAEDDQYAFLLGKGNSVVAVDKKTGEVKFTSRRSDLVAFAQNTTDGVIFATTKAGRVIAAVAVKHHGEVGELVWAEPADLPAYN